MRKIERNIFNLFICRLMTIIRIHLMVSKEERERERKREREREMVSILIPSSLPFLLCSFLKQTPQW